MKYIISVLLVMLLSGCFDGFGSPALDRAKQDVACESYGGVALYSGFMRHNTYCTSGVAVPRIVYSLIHGPKVTKAYNIQLKLYNDRHPVSSKY